MGINLEHTSISDKKISPMAPVVDRNIQVSFGKVTFAPPCSIGNTVVALFENDRVTNYREIYLRGGGSYKRIA